MRALAAALLCAAAVAGCGGEDKAQGGAPQGHGGGPPPKGSLSQAAERFERAVQSGDCRAMADITIHSSRREGRLQNTTDPPSAPECRQLAAFRRSFAGYRAGAGEQYGSAGVVDAEVRGKQTSSVFVLDIDRTWVHFVSRTPPHPKELGTEPDDAGASDRAAGEYLRALRAGDCGTAYRLTNPDSPQLRGGVDERGYCRRLRSAEKLSYGFPARIRQARSVKPRPLGKTKSNAFYAIQLPDGAYWTLVVAGVDERVSERAKGNHDDPAVLDYLRANRDRR